MRELTKLIMAIVVVSLILWDLIAYFFGENATISVIVTDFSYYTPWVPFVLGVLIGHWLFPAKGSKD